jgi:hypothetical protein
MFKCRYFHLIISGMLLFVMVYANVQAQPEIPDLTSNSDEARFVYDDILNFLNAYEQLSDGVDSLSILQTEYLDKGTPGLEMYIEKYNLTAQMLVEAIQENPKKYSELHKMPELLESYSEESRKAYSKLKDYIPDIVYPPTYFLVGAYRGIGSSSKVGSLISVESWPIPIKGRMTMLVHELVHFQQVMAVGLEKYIALYGAEKNLLGLSIREGTPEFFTDLVLGKITQTEALEFTLKNETRLWEQFSKEMHGSEPGEWMWKKPSDPEQPYYVGYALGYRIVKAYYENADDKGQALREILSVTDYPNFLEKSGYAQQFDE